MAAERRLIRYGEPGGRLPAYVTRAMLTVHGGAGRLLPVTLTIFGNPLPTYSRQICHANFMIMADPGRIEPFSFAGSSDIDHNVSIRMYVCNSFVCWTPYQGRD